MDENLDLGISFDLPKNQSNVIKAIGVGGRALFLIIWSCDLFDVFSYRFVLDLILRSFTEVMLLNLLIFELEITTHC